MSARRLAGASMLGGLIAAALVYACGDDDSAAPVGTDGGDAMVTLKVPPSDAGAAVDAADAAVRPAPVPPDSDASTVKLANLSDDVFNVCLDGEHPFVPEPLPPRTVSERVVLDGRSIRARLVLPGETCATSQYSQTFSALNPSVDAATQGRGRFVMFYRGAAFTNRRLEATNESVETTPGKETMVLHRLSDPVEFRPESGAVVPIPVSQSTYPQIETLIDGDVVGTLVGAGVQRRLKTKAGGALGIWAFGTTLIVCDDLAPLVDGHTDCTAAVRAP